MAYAMQPITVTANTTLVAENHAFTTVVLDSSTGRTITLPASAGKGDWYEIYVKTTVSSGNHVVQVANSTDVMNGVISIATDVAGVTFPLAATDDTITMNGSTQGGLAGSWLKFTDVASGFWKIEGCLVSSGAEADPATAAV